MQLRVWIFSVIFLNFFGGITTVTAQINSPIYSFSLNGHIGYVLPEYKNMSYLVTDFAKGTEINFEKRTNGSKECHSSYNFPSFGLSAFYATLGNHKVHGEEFGLFPYFKVPIFVRKKFSLVQQIGIGMSYATEKFDLETNYLNVSIGSNINVHFNFRLGAMYRINNRLAVNLGASFSHLSNANLAEPNLGLNSFTAYSGLRYNLKDESPYNKSILNPHSKRNTYYFAYNFGGKHTRSLNSKIWATSSISVEARRAISRIIQLGIGFDTFYDSSTKTDFENSADFKPINNFKTGLHLSQTIVYNKASLSLQEGFYIGLVDKANHYVMYNRLLFRYAVTNYLFCSIAMKSHVHILDSPEIGFGYSLPANKKHKK